MKGLQFSPNSGRGPVSSVPMRERLQGIVLFLPVPAVLWLLTQRPLGTWPSLGLGVTLMVTHRLYARPFVLARKDGRCLWCGRAGDADHLQSIKVVEPMGESTWRACSGDHQARLRGFLGWASRNSLFLKIGIAGTLLAYLVGVPLAAYGKLGPVTSVDLSYGFRLLIALNVLPLGWLGPASGSGSALKLPFPVHIQALIGTVAVVWLFRIVGMIWLATSVIHFQGG